MSNFGIWINPNPSLHDTPSPAVTDPVRLLLIMTLRLSRFRFQQFLSRWDRNGRVSFATMKTPQQAVSTSRPDVSTSTDSQRLPQGSSTRTDCLSAVEARRSYRRLSSASPIPDSRLLDIVRSIVKFSPSSHNSQSTRLLILLGNDHKEFWDITLSTLKGMVSSSRIGPTEEKIQGLRSAYGTILCYEDLATVRKLENSYPLYKDNFMSWSEQTNAMHQILLWTALESEGLGCTLQHYNPLIDEKIAIRWNVSSDWSLKGQLVFGIPSGTPEPKTYKPLEERIIVFGGEL